MLNTSRLEAFDCENREMISGLDGERIDVTITFLMQSELKVEQVLQSSIEITI